MSKQKWIRKIETPLGPLWASADEKALLALTFTNPLEGVEGNSPLLDKIEQELAAYFAGKLKVFQTPYRLEGSPFQRKSWQAMTQVPFGGRASYQEQAKIVGNEKAFRAVANANAANPLLIIVPCHRILRKNGQVGGYAAGEERKRWLLDHEKKFA